MLNKILASAILIFSCSYALAGGESTKGSFSQVLIKKMGGRISHLDCQKGNGIIYKDEWANGFGGGESYTAVCQAQKKNNKSATWIAFHYYSVNEGKEANENWLGYDCHYKKYGQQFGWKCSKLEKAMTLEAKYNKNKMKMYDSEVQMTSFITKP